METKMKRTYLLAVLALLASFTLALGSPVTIGTKSKLGPGKLAICQAAVDGINDLGTGTFNSLITGGVIADLKDANSGTSVLKMDITDVPGGFCTVEGVAADAAKAVCTSAYSVLGLKPLTASDGTIWGVEWNCQKITEPDSPFWIRADCP
jgi:hypothetical protein